MSELDDKKKEYKQNTNEFVHWVISDRLGHEANDMLLAFAQIGKVVQALLIVHSKLVEMGATFTEEEQAYLDRVMAGAKFVKTVVELGNKLNDEVDGYKDLSDFDNYRFPKELIP